MELVCNLVNFFFFTCDVPIVFLFLQELLVDRGRIAAHVIQVYVKSFREIQATVMLDVLHIHSVPNSIGNESVYYEAEDDQWVSESLLEVLLGVLATP